MGAAPRLHLPTLLNAGALHLAGRRLAVNLVAAFLPAAVLGPIDNDPIENYDGMKITVVKPKIPGGTG